MNCFIRINSAWVAANSSSIWFKIFCQRNLPIAHLDTSGNISYGHKGVDAGITLPMVHISTNNTRLYIEERAANLAHDTGYWGYVQIYVHSYTRRNDTGSETVLCMFYVPDDNTDGLSSVANIPEKVNLLKYYPNMDEKQMRKNLIVADVMMV